MKLTLLLAATAFFGVQELSAVSLRSEGVKEKSSGVQDFWTSGVQTNASDELSSQELKGVKGHYLQKQATCQLVNSSTY